MGFRLANVGGRAALLDGEHYFDLERLTRGGFDSDPMAAIARHTELHEVDLAGAAPDGSLADVTLGPPVPRPTKVFGVGLNYRDHAAETAAELPEVPLVFTKFPSCLVGPSAAVALRGERVDWEVELVVVIGARGRDFAKSEAWNHVAGVTVGQDISDREVQRRGAPPQFSLGKSFDTYGPTGPAVVSPDLLADRDDLAIRCDISGEPMQDARTRDLIFSVADLVTYLAAITTLEPGDLIFTGTPSGVGAPRGRFLKDGDVIVSEIEGVGRLTNPCERH